MRAERICGWVVTAGLWACTPHGDDDALFVPESVEPIVEATASESPSVDAGEPESTMSDEDASPACERARARAREDFERGTATLHAWGYPSSCAFEYWDLLEKWYGIHTAHHGCVVDATAERTLDEQRCYRPEVERLVMRRHGRDAFEKAERRAGCR